MEERIGFGQNYIQTGQTKAVLILIVMEERIGSVKRRSSSLKLVWMVLILIVMEERIGSFDIIAYCCVLAMYSLNPYCNGRKNRIFLQRIRKTLIIRAS